MNKSTKAKIALLLMMTFVLSAGSAIVLYATGNEVIATGVLQDHIYMVSHTEYRYAEEGQIVVRLVNSAGVPIAVNSCNATILYPNKTIFLGPALMYNTTTISGDHYYNFTTPNGPEGVYEYQATCYWSPNKQESATNSFHLSGAFNTLLNRESVDALSDAIFYWSFDNNGDMASSAATSIVDLSPHLWDMTVLGNGGYTIFYPSGVLGNAAYTDGSSAYILGKDLGITYDGKKEWTEVAGEWSYNTWLNLNNPTNSMAIWAWMDNSMNGTPQSGLWFEPTTNVSTLFDLNGNVEYNLNGMNLANGSFHMLTLVKTGDKISSVDMYIDNVLAPKTVNLESTPTTFGWPGLGGRYFGDGNNFDAIPDSGVIIDETGAWDFALTKAQRDKLYSKYNPYNDINRIVNLSFKIDGLSQTMQANFNQVFADIAATNSSLSSQMNKNTTAILNAINGLNVSVNLTGVLSNQVVMQAYLTQINQTTVDIYSYMTGTLATNINSILSQLGVINATLNRVETNTQNINSTVNQILQNQNDQVYISVYSG